MKYKYLLFGLVSFFAYLLFSYGIAIGVMKDADFAFTVKLQERIDNSDRLRLAEFVGNLMEGSTFFASPEFSLIVISIFSFVCFLHYRGWKRITSLVILVLFGFLIGAEVVGKTLIHHPSPPFFMIKNPTTIFPKYYINDMFSYPSGHAARAIFIVVIGLTLGFFELKKRSVFTRFIIFVTAILYVVLVSISRIYLGHHWLSDVIGGWMIGFGSSTMFSYVTDEIHRIK